MIAHPVPLSGLYGLIRISPLVAVVMGDIFGARSVSTQLVADHWSRAGFKVLLPDFLEGGGKSTEHFR